MRLGERQTSRKAVPLLTGTLLYLNMANNDNVNIKCILLITCIFIVLIIIEPEVGSFMWISGWIIQVMDMWVDGWYDGEATGRLYGPDRGVG